MSRTRKNLLLIGCVSAVVVPGVFLFYMLSARVDRGTTPEMVCWTNLRNIDTAEEVWAIENHKTTNDTPSWGDLQKSLYSTNMICPAGGTYTLAGSASHLLAAFRRTRPFTAKIEAPLGRQSREHFAEPDCFRQRRDYV